jgi:hypothetical protein
LIEGTMSNATGVREFLQLTVESAYLTPKTSPVRGTDLLVIPLVDGNAYTVRPNPVVIDLPYGGGYAVRRSSVSDKMELRGKLRTRLCYSQAAVLLGLGLQRVNSGQTAPWVNTEPVGDLASVTIDHAIFQDDTATYKRRRHKGLKCAGGSFEIGEDSEVGTLELDLVGSTPEGNTIDDSSDPDDTAFPVPDDDEYPTDYVLFTDSGGNVHFNNVLFGEYTSLRTSWTNKLDVKFFARHFVQKIRCYGRDVMLDSDVILRQDPDFRGSLYEATAALASTSLVFNNGTHAITFDWKTNSRIKSLDDNLPLETIYGRRLSLASGYDVANTTDFSFSYS